MDIQKLENNRLSIGGIASKGLLVTAFRICQEHEDRVSSLKGLRWIPEQDLTTDGLRRILRKLDITVD